MKDNIEPPGGPLFPMAEAARYLNVTPRWIRRQVEERRLEYVKMGGLVYFRKSVLDEFVERNIVAAVED